jgi:ABC-type dipeptide/oligopeptide/nickel transport system permease subunit
VISRITEIVMAFPVLLFVIALASTAGEHLDNITFGFLGKGVMTLIFVLGIFGWFYPAASSEPRSSPCVRRSSSRPPA